MSIHRPVLALLLACLAALPLSAARSLCWCEKASALQEGELDGIAVTTRGSLYPAPEVTRIPNGTDSGSPAYVWSMAADASGNVFVGTGPEGWILKLDVSGRQKPFFQADQPMVTALAVLPDGSLLAGTAPEGRIYKIDSGGNGELWCETRQRYVWDIAPGADGRVFAATGENGIVYEISPRGDPDPFFDSSEAHIVSLAALPDGGILAGGAGKGILYRLDAAGHALVLHDDPLPEVSDLVSAPDGSIYAAFLAPPSTSPKRPAVRIQLPESAAVGAASDQVEGLEERPGATMQGIIEGLPAVPDEGPTKLTGKVVRIDRDESVAELWRSTVETPFALDLDQQGRLLFGTGEPARLYRVDGADEIALLATLREAHVTGLMRRGSGFLLASSNPAALYRLRWDGGGSGVFLSKPFDAGGPARWGSIRWSSNGLPGYVELYTRTGNSAEPDATWSAWSPALTNRNGSPIENPDGRFLQWRVRMAQSSPDDSRISGVTVSYSPYNRPPAIEGFALQGGSAAVRDAARFRWRWMDEDGDPVRVSLDYRKPGEKAWNGAASVTLSPAAAGSGKGGKWSDGELAWNVGGIEEAAYEIRVRASDQPGNHPGEGRIREVEHALLVRVDRTPPRLRVSREGGGDWTVAVTDSLSGIVRLEVLDAGETAFLARPADGVSDSPEETFMIPATAIDGSGPWTVRALDEAGNAVEQPLKVG